jgi:4-hydroxy-tetrahydrodipicolinate synthase
MTRGSVSQTAELTSRLHGVLTALITPYDEKGEVSLSAIERHVEYQIASGVCAIFPGSTMGEFPLLSTAERCTLLKQTVQACGGRVPVIATASYNRPSQVAQMAEYAREAGADGLLVMVPPFFALDEDEQYDFYRWLSERAPLPLVIYASENTASQRPSLDLLERLFSLGTVSAVKEAVTDPDRAWGIMQRIGPHGILIAAAEKALPAVLPAGAKAVLTATSCFAPKVIRRVIDSAGETAALELAFTPIHAFRRLFQDQMDTGLPRYLPWTKAACELTGLPAGVPRWPIRPLDAAARARLADVLTAHFRQELPQVQR